MTACDTTVAIADCDGDGVNNDIDVDDDNDGLIEISFVEDLHNVRFDLVGHSYDDETDDAAADAAATPAVRRRQTAPLWSATRRRPIMSGCAATN